MVEFATGVFSLWWSHDMVTSVAADQEFDVLGQPGRTVEGNAMPSCLSQPHGNVG